MSGDFWFVDHDDQEQGPVEKDVIVRMITAGSIRRESQIWSAGMQDWRMASQVEEFSPLFGPARPPARTAVDRTKQQIPAIFQDKRAIIAALILAASLFPFTAGANSASIVGIHGIVAGMNQFLKYVSPAGPMDRSTYNGAIGQISAALNVLLVLYAIPISALFVLFTSFTTGRSKAPSVFNGAVSVALPILVPLITIELIKSSLPQQLSFLSGQFSNGIAFDSLGIGFWMVVILGAFQLFFSIRDE